MSPLSLSLSLFLLSVFLSLSPSVCQSKRGERQRGGREREGGQTEDNRERKERERERGTEEKRCGQKPWGGGSRWGVEERVSWTLTWLDLEPEMETRRGGRAEGLMNLAA